jgi:hypothetical protein
MERLDNLRRNRMSYDERFAKVNELLIELTSYTGELIKPWQLIAYMCVKQFVYKIFSHSSFYTFSGLAPPSVYVAHRNDISNKRQRIFIKILFINICIYVMHKKLEKSINRPLFLF